MNNFDHLIEKKCQKTEYFNHNSQEESKDSYENSESESRETRERREDTRRETREPKLNHEKNLNLNRSKGSRYSSIMYKLGQSLYMTSPDQLGTVK